MDQEPRYLLSGWRLITSLERNAEACSTINVDYIICDPSVGDPLSVGGRDRLAPHDIKRQGKGMQLMYYSYEDTMRRAWPTTVRSQGR